MAKGIAKVFWTSFVTSLVVSGIVCFCFYYFCIQGQFVEVPKVIGEKVEEARFLLEKKSLRLFVSQQEPSSVYPKDVIIKQDPSPYMEVRKNSVVNVVVSLGEEKKVIPNVIGMRLEDAKAQIGKLGLMIGKIDEVYSKEQPKGSVIEISPYPGEEVKEGTRVDMKVSMGVKVVPKPKEEPKVEVPNLFGKNLETATNILNQKGLSVGNIYYTCDEEYEFRIILKQEPAAGTWVKKGSKVNVTINHEE